MCPMSLCVSKNLYVNQNKMTATDNLIELNPSVVTTKPFVSVSIIAYNQEQYIRQALDRILSQKTNFSFEVVIGDDDSKDKTRAICLEYVEKYPNIVRLLPPAANVGMMKNHIRTIKACRGTYVALLESDDYWIDDLKLQKQIDALEQDPKLTACFTGRKNYHENEDRFEEVYNDIATDRFTLEDFAQDTFFHTCTMAFRKPKSDIWLDRIADMPLSDRPLYLSLLSESGGYALKLKDLCAVFRLNESSVFTPLKPVQRTKMAADMYENLKKLFPNLGIYLNKHLNIFDYFLLRYAHKNKDKAEVKRLIKQILGRPTKPSGWLLKAKTFVHYFI